mmetsp:Transcript_16919/g.25515  ORF Transcript_16919/g.25515 Transcript_16919/m.25515 type:complete len:159 (+) Transcript_16919:93-569(+)
MLPDTYINEYNRSTANAHMNQHMHMNVNRSALIEAYSTKKDMKINSRAHTAESTRRCKLLRPSTPKRPPPKSEGHIAGDICNHTQRKLAQKEMFTGIQKMKYDSRANLENGSGEVCTAPSRAIRLLNSRTYKELNIPTRTGDFRNEVEWRLQLRPQFN